MTIGFTQQAIVRIQKEVNTQEFFRILLNNPVLTNIQIDRLVHLIHAGINLDAQDEILHFPLLECVKRNNLKLVQELILYGANVNLKSYVTDNSALHTATQIGNKDIVELLIDAGAEIDAKDALHQTPLHIALSFGKTDIAKILINSEAKLDLRNVRGCTALHLAVIKRQTEIIKILLEKKAEVDVKNTSGETPLLIAILDSTADIFQLLLNAGADLGARNINGRSPLQRKFECLGSWSLELIEKNLIFIINKFIEAGSWRFDNLRKELGVDFASVETTDEMATKILIQNPIQYITSIRTIEQLYPNPRKMAAKSLLARLLDVLENPPAESSAASSSSLVCTDDEQTSIISPSLTKRGKRGSRDKREKCDGALTYSRKWRSFFFRK